jgi:hypothetical protein
VHVDCLHNEVTDIDSGIDVEAGVKDGRIRSVENVKTDRPGGVKAGRGVEKGKEHQSVVCETLEEGVDDGAHDGDGDVHGRLRREERVCQKYTGCCQRGSEHAPGSRGDGAAHERAILASLNFPVKILVRKIIDDAAIGTVEPAEDEPFETAV